MGAADVSGLDRLDPRDREYVESLDDPREQAVVAETILRYQKPDRLRVGDPLPALEAFRLEDGGAMQLEDLLEDRPLVLVLGSFT
jgi:hypothetical protein